MHSRLICHRDIKPEHASWTQGIGSRVTRGDLEGEGEPYPMSCQGDRLQDRNRVPGSWLRLHRQSWHALLLLAPGNMCL